MGSAGCSLLWAAQTNWNHHGRLLSTTIDAFEPSIEEKNGSYTCRDTTKWFFNMTMLGHMKNGSKPTWKWLNGKSYPNCCIHQTLPHPIITCSDWWHMAWLSSTSILMKMSKMSPLIVSLKRLPVFPMWNSIAARKMGKKLWLVMDNTFSDMFLTNFWK